MSNAGSVASCLGGSVGCGGCAAGGSVTEGAGSSVAGGVVGAFCSSLAVGCVAFGVSGSAFVSAGGVRLSVCFSLSEETGVESLLTLSDAACSVVFAVLPSAAVSAFLSSTVLSSLPAEEKNLFRSPTVRESRTLCGAAA